MFDDRDDDVSLDRRTLLFFLEAWMFDPTILLFVTFLSEVVTVSVERAIILLMILRPTIVAILALFVVLLVVLLIRQRCLDFWVGFFILRF